MSDGISDGRRARDLWDIKMTGAGYITDRELNDIIEELAKLRHAYPLLLDVEKHGLAYRIPSHLINCAMIALGRPEKDWL